MATWRSLLGETAGRVGRSIFNTRQFLPSEQAMSAMNSVEKQSEEIPVLHCEDATLRPLFQIHQRQNTVNFSLPKPPLTGP